MRPCLILGVFFTLMSGCFAQAATEATCSQDVILLAETHPDTSDFLFNLMSTTASRQEQSRLALNTFDSTGFHTHFNLDQRDGDSTLQLANTALAQHSQGHSNGQDLGFHMQSMSGQFTNERERVLIVVAMSESLSGFGSVCDAVMELQNQGVSTLVIGSGIHAEAHKCPNMEDHHFVYSLDGTNEGLKSTLDSVTSKLCEDHRAQGHEEAETTDGDEAVSPAKRKVLTWSSCPAGKYSWGYTCYSCTAGKYQPYKGFTYCWSCPSGKTSKSGATSCSSSSSSSCPAGKYKSGSYCKNCPSGKYSSKGKTYCSNCPSGKYSGSGYSYCYSKTTSCPSGKYKSGNSCYSCPAGKYNSKSGKTWCNNCPSGKYSKSGATYCFTTSTSCPAGKYKSGNSCYNCPAGKYNSKSGKSSCNSCPSGKYSNSGATYCFSKTTKKPTTSKPVYCPAGKYRYANSCKSCPAGKFTSSGGKTYCSNCPSGKYSNSGSSYCYSKTSCPAGRYKSGNSCYNCPAGKYNSKSGKTSCNSCPSGKYSYSGATYCFTKTTKQPTQSSKTTKRPTVVYCPAGKYRYGSSCKNCPAGKFTSSGGKTYCSNCPSGKYSGSGSSYCYSKTTSCPAGRYKYGNSCYNCPAGKYNSKSGKSSCNSCPAGKYNSKSGKSWCNTCPSGKYSPGGSTYCYSKTTKSPTYSKATRSPTKATRSPTKATNRPTTKRPTSKATRSPTKATRSPTKATRSPTTKRPSTTCSWSSWGAWSKCQVTCTKTSGQYVWKLRYRSCSCSWGCSGSSVQYSKCTNIPPCSTTRSPTTKRPTTKATRPPTKATRSPTKATRSPTKATRPPTKATRAPTKATRSPTTRRPTAPFCVWSSWGSWSSCPATCQVPNRTYYRFRTRKCKCLIGCPGSSIQYQKCTGLKPCISTRTPTTKKPTMMTRKPTIMTRKPTMATKMPTTKCAKCKGGVSHLRFRSNFRATVLVKITNAGGDSSDDDDSTTSGNGDVLFARSVPGGTSFDLELGCKKGIKNINIYVSSVKYSLDVSCNKPIGIGLRIGGLQITAGSSCLGGKLCPYTSSTAKPTRKPYTTRSPSTRNPTPRPNCYWKAWGAWGNCPKTCQLDKRLYYRYRYRKCSCTENCVGNSYYCNFRCIGASYEYSKCNLPPCTKTPTTRRPTVYMTKKPTPRVYTKSPTQKHTRFPTRAFTRFPTRVYTKRPTTKRPTPYVFTKYPTVKYTRQPTTKRPSFVWTRFPTRKYTRHPTPRIFTRFPTQNYYSTHRPTTKRPSFVFTRYPTMKQTRRPTTKRPTPYVFTRRPTMKMTKKPTMKQTKKPTTTKRPTFVFTRRPTVKITRRPTMKMTKRPTVKITKRPTTKRPTMRTRSPTPYTKPPTTKSPTTRRPTRRPTKKPTPRTRPPTKATRPPTRKPTTKRPTRRPRSPTQSPTRAPTRAPTKSPTRKPTKKRIPTIAPTNAPTYHLVPFKPTPCPNDTMTHAPTPQPTMSPTRCPYAKHRVVIWTVKQYETLYVAVDSSIVWGFAAGLHTLNQFPTKAKFDNCDFTGSEQLCSGPVNCPPTRFLVPGTFYFGSSIGVACKRGQKIRVVVTACQSAPPTRRPTTKRPTRKPTTRRPTSRPTPYCPAGRYKTGKYCHDCPSGKYQPAPKQSHCKTCPFGKYQPSKGKTTCSTCPRQCCAATYLTHCPASYYKGTYWPRTARRRRAYVRCGAGRTGYKYRKCSEAGQWSTYVKDGCKADPYGNANRKIVRFGLRLRGMSVSGASARKPALVSALAKVIGCSTSDILITVTSSNSRRLLQTESDLEVAVAQPDAAAASDLSSEVAQQTFATDLTEALGTEMDDGAPEVTISPSGVSTPSTEGAPQAATTDILTAAQDNPSGSSAVTMYILIGSIMAGALLVLACCCCKWKPRWMVDDDEKPQRPSLHMRKNSGAPSESDVGGVVSPTGISRLFSRNQQTAASTEFRPWLHTPKGSKKHNRVVSLAPSEQSPASGESESDSPAMPTPGRGTTTPGRPAALRVPESPGLYRHHHRRQMSGSRSPTLSPRPRSARLPQSGSFTMGTSTPTSTRSEGGLKRAFSVEWQQLPTIPASRETDETGRDANRETTLEGERTHRRRGAGGRKRMTREQSHQEMAAAWDSVDLAVVDDGDMSGPVAGGDIETPRRGARAGVSFTFDDEQRQRQQQQGMGDLYNLMRTVTHFFSDNEEAAARRRRGSDASDASASYQESVSVESAPNEDDFSSDEDDDEPSFSTQSAVLH